MSNIIKTLALSAVIFAAAPQFASATSMSGDMAGMDMSGNSAKGDTANASGVVKKIDTASGMVTLQHGPIPAIQWPAMTMGFKVADPALLKNIKEGEEVDFSLKPENGNQVVVAIAAKK
jgi:Cu(I)/Ag(I) efflux system protein CusF